MLFTFPSRYSFAIGLSVVFSLSGWSPIIQPEFLVFRHTQVASRFHSASRTGLSPVAARHSRRFRPLPDRFTTLLLPRLMPCDTAGLGFSPFARHYWGNRCYFLFLRVLRCFSSPRSPCAIAQCRDRSRRVAPFGHPGVSVYLPLAPAFRSLSRPSSPPRAKASPMRPSSFRFIFITDYTAIFKRGLKSDFCSPLVCSFL